MGSFKEKKRRVSGFTMAEMLIVVAIIAILSAVAAAFFNPDDISYVEYNRSAEAIAVAAQNSLTSHRTSGDAAVLDMLRKIGQPASGSAEGGYRYVFSHVEKEGGYEKNPQMNYILPAGAVDFELSDKYFAIGFQSATCTVGEVFYSEKPFDGESVSYLETLKGKEEVRKAAGIGYYVGETDNAEVAFANLPTPQVTISNYENLTLSVYLPEVKQLENINKRLAFRVSLADENGEAYKNGITLDDTAIYRTYGEKDGTNVPQDIKTGVTYKFILDTPQPCSESDMSGDLTLGETPTGKFESWAKRSKAFTGDKRYFKLGDNVSVTVTVFCLEGDTYTVDPTFMPRSATVTFNGWFNTYDGNDTVTIACGRHLQNLGNLSEPEKNISKYLPKWEIDGTGKYTYTEYNRGMAHFYTDGDVDNYKDEDINVNKKYAYRDDVEDKIYKAEQVKTIDFDCAEWKRDGKPIPFTPINLPNRKSTSDGFRYYGQYMTINHLYVDAPFYAGLFGFAYHHRLYDILLVDPSVTSHVPSDVAEMYEIGAGALIGTSRNSDYIYNCQVYMTENKEDYRVSGDCYVGGLIGFCEDEAIESCSASVNTGYASDSSKSSQYVGGLLGCITGDSSLVDCYAAGNLRGGYVGGLVGLILTDSNQADNDYRITTCYTAGHIEYAEKSAAGLLGYIDEKSGYSRTSVNARGNYCVVVYGENEGGEYSWDSTAPIYGTFEGDGFEWISTTNKGNQLSGRYGTTMSVGAVFEDDDLNYFIPQKGLEDKYQNSDYYAKAAGLLNDFIKEAEEIENKDELQSLAGKYKEKMEWIRKLQILDEMDALLQEIVEKVEEDQSTDAEGNRYSLGGFWGNNGKEISEGGMYLRQTRAIFESESKEEKYKGIFLTVEQAIHAIYDGTFDDGTAAGGKIEKITYEGSDKDLQDAKNYSVNFIFKDLKKEMDNKINDLLDSKEANDADAKKVLQVLIGDDSTEDGYKKGLLYKIYYDNLLERLFEKSQNYYINFMTEDKNGKIIYAYYLGLASDWKHLLIDLSITSETRENLLIDIKAEALISEKTGDDKKKDDVQDMLDSLYEIVGKWNGSMKGHTKEVQGLIQTAKDKVLELQTALKNKKHITVEMTKSTGDAINTIYEFFDGKDIKDLKDIVDKNGTIDEMRKLRSKADDIRDAAACIFATVNSGAEGALDELIYRLDDESPDCSELKEACIKKLEIYLGKNWENHDSGHRIYDAKELRDLARGFPKGKEIKEENRDTSIRLGFMYDYGNDHSGNDYYKKLVNGSYVDLDNHIYNNVFPYTESVHTKYYPFPFVYGMDIHDTKYQATYILFHYGDWLTEDLWAENEPAGGA